MKPSDLFSACMNLSERHYYTAKSFGGVQLHIYHYLYISKSNGYFFKKIDTF